VTDLEDKDLDLWRVSQRPLGVAATSAMVLPSGDCITWQRAVAEFTSRHFPGPHPLWHDDALTQFQLVKHYPSGSVIEVRTITKPVAGTVQVYLDGIEQASGWSIDTTTGLVTFSMPPALGVEVTADFEFDVPVRFDTDHMAVTIESYRLHAWQQIPIVEVRA
jgi:hypothetical protein